MSLRLALLAVLAILTAVPCWADGGTKATVRMDGTLVVNGTPVFLVGFYHVSWMKNRMGQGQRDDLLTISKAGFDFIHPTIDLRADGAVFLELAAEQEVWVLPEINSKILGQVIERYREQPAIIGWNIGDDVTSKGDPDEIEAANHLVKRLAPGHLTYVSAYNSGEAWLKAPGVEVWMRAGVDLIGMQCYPIPWDREHGRHGGFDYAPGPHATSNYRARVYYGMRRTVEKAREFGHKGVIANLQCFKWDRNGDQWRWPTPAELENMTYQAVVAGVNGILYYTFYDGATFLPDHPEQFQQVRKTAVELRALTPVLLNGKRTLGPDGENAGVSVFYSIWEYEGNLYTIVVNTSESESSEDVRIKLPTVVVGQAIPIFEGRPSSLQVAGQELTGTIQTNEVQICRIKMRD